MKRVWLIFLLLIVHSAAAQNATSGKPCIAFSPGDESAGTDGLAKDPLATAVTLSGDFEFYASSHAACGTVEVLSLPVQLENGVPIGYAISYTVTDPKSIQIYHGLQCGPDRNAFEQAMRKAAAEAVKDIRFTQYLYQLTPEP